MNDYFSGRKTMGGSSSRGGSMNSFHSIVSEIESSADAKDEALQNISKQISLYCMSVIKGQTSVHDINDARKQFDSLLKAARLTDAEAKAVLIDAMSRAMLNA
jgi:hypothetical protein